MSKLNDLTGQKFGFLTVIKRAPNRKNDAHAYWECQCDCGQTYITQGTLLTQGRVHSCGCGGHNLINRSFGRLTVIAQAQSRQGRRYWTCQCSCGNIVEVSSKSLLDGSTQSCGCLKKEWLRQFNIETKSKINQSNIIGQYFDYLEVIDRAHPIDGHTAYLCYCHNCGNKKIIKYSDLVSNRVHACGCLLSWGEARFKHLLYQHDISFKTQYKFQDLVSQKGYPLRFDFAIFEDNKLQMLIEYQGDQHYNEDNPYWTPTLAQHDQLKREYCQLHQIQLYYIDKNTNLEDFIIQNIKRVV